MHTVYFHCVKFTRALTLWETYYSGIFLLRIEVVENMSEMRAIVNCHSCLHCWYWFSPEDMRREQPGAKWLLSLNSLCNLASPRSYWKLMMVGRTGRQTQGQSAKLSSPRPDLDFQDYWNPFQKLTPIRSLSVCWFNL